MKFDAKGIFKRFKRERFLGLTGPKAGGFLSLTGLWPEGCGGGFATIFKKGGAASAAGCVEGLHRFAQGATAALPLRVMVAPFGAQRTQFALCELDL